MATGIFLNLEYLNGDETYAHEYMSFWRVWEGNLDPHPHHPNPPLDTF